MAIGTSALAWVERVRTGEGPLYLAIVRALEQSIETGDLSPGDRLPPQRELAARLGVDLTTVTRAYSVARTLGLLEGAVGRGSFVRARTEDDEVGLVDLSMNLPPPPEGLSLGAMLQETMTAILQRTDPTVLMAYHPGFGAPGQRRAGAEWLAPCLGERTPESLLVSAGAQAGLAAALSVLCRPGDTVVAEPLTYPGFKAVAAQLGLRVVACASDEKGAIPESIEALCQRERPAAVYLVPTMQNPTATTMPLRRRREVAGGLRRGAAWLIEDDPYSRLCEAPLPAVSSFLPERSIYIGTLAKTLSPGLRIAYVACPGADDAVRVADALRAIALMPAPLMAAVATTWIREGRAETLLGAVRAEARARRALAARIIPAATGSDESLHVWLPLASEASQRLRLVAQQRGLALVTHETFAVSTGAAAGVRLSLGGPGRRQSLEAALQRLAELLAESPASSRRVV